ncbi:MAG TPA: S49 family peptidase, partial [Candidatus Melainabacteria bacterium]|nr:S49 family peptidase [Candidatus Melainabacteria bacterium]
ADGRIYSGRQALKNGLVDKLGSYEDALNDLQSTCKKKYGLKKELKVDDDNSDSLLESLFDTSSKITGFSSASSASMFDEVLPMTMRARFYNQPLWMMP